MRIRQCKKHERESRPVSFTLRDVREERGFYSETGGLSLFSFLFFLVGAENRNSGAAWIYTLAPSA